MTAITDDAAAASVLERYDYTPYGALKVLDANFAADADGASDVANAYTYTGREYDSETGLYNFRNRYFHAQLGRFVGRDPIGYWDGFNLYESYSVPNGVDPYGLQQPIDANYPFYKDKPERWELARYYGYGADITYEEMLDWHRQNQESARFGNFPNLPIRKPPGGDPFEQEINRPPAPMPPVGPLVDAGLTVGTFFVPPLDWALTAGDIYQEPKNPWTYLSLLVPGRLGKCAPNKVPTPSLKGVGKIADAKIPDHVPTNWSKADIEDAIADYERSVEIRKAEEAAFDAAGGGHFWTRKAHYERITEEEEFLHKLRRRFEDLK